MALRRGSVLVLVLLAAASAAHEQEDHNRSLKDGHELRHKHELSRKGSGKDGSKPEDARELQEPAADVPTLGPPVSAPTLPPLKQMPEAKPVPISWDRFDCYTGVDSIIQLGWSHDQREWCCQHKEIGCDNKAVNKTHKEDEFHCQDVMEALIWKDDKRIWCCERKELGCSGPNKEPFDCEENLLIFEMAWSTPKQDWCCKKKELGCKGKKEAKSNILGALAGSELMFDCSDDGYLDLWSSDKKAWCCGYSGKGCETSTTTKTTTTVTTTSTTNLGCRMECEIDGVKDTCLNHIQKSSLNDFLGDDHACSTAHEYILGKCPACEICSAHEAGCNVLEGPTTTTPAPTTTPEPKGCYKPCLLGGILADCRSRIQWSAEHIYFWNKTACHKAYDLVMGQCDVCGDCEKEETGCDEARPADKGKEDPYDCDAGYAKWEKGWSSEKKAWCCKHKERGCKEDHKKEVPETVFRKKFDQTALRHSSASATQESSKATILFAAVGISGLSVAVFVVRRVTARGSYVNVPGLRADAPILE